jgi:hypothetical protein
MAGGGPVGNVEEGRDIVAAEILNKPGKPGSGELAKISLHPVLGATHLRMIS